MATSRILKHKRPVSKPAKLILPPTAHVLTISLTAFQYDLNYELVDGADIGYEIDILHRIPIGKAELDMLINVTYLEEGRDKPFLSASCLTTYRLEGMEMKPSEEESEMTIIIPDHLMQQMHQEAISHTRALIAVQTASTPYSKTHIALDTRLVRIPEEKIAQ